MFEDDFLRVPNKPAPTMLDAVCDVLSRARAAKPTIHDSYPNLSALVDGCVSGRISEWPQMKVEARKALKEIEGLRFRMAGLEK